MKKSQELWFTLLDKQILRLKQLKRRSVGIVESTGGPIGTTSITGASTAVKIVLGNLINHLQLGWAIFQDDVQSQNTLNSSPLRIPLTMPVPTEAEMQFRKVTESRGTVTRPVDDTYRPWWDRTIKFTEFAKHASKVIRTASRLSGKTLPNSTSLPEYYKTFLRVTGLKDQTKRKSDELLGAEAFAVAIANLLGFDLQKAQKGLETHNLSNLLTLVEKRLEDALDVS